MRINPHIIARCPACASEVSATGVCPICAPLERTRNAAHIRRRDAELKRRYRHPHGYIAGIERSQPAEAD